MGPAPPPLHAVAAVAAMIAGALAKRWILDPLLAPRPDQETAPTH